MAKLETKKEEREKWLEEAERVIGSLTGQANQWCRVPLKAQLSSATREAGLIRDVDKTLLALRGMMEIAELAMPDTFFQTDSRVCAARELTT